MKKGLPGVLGNKNPTSAPSSQHLFPPPAQPREEIQCRSSKPARRAASAGLTQESKGGTVPRPLRQARREGEGRGAAQRGPTHLLGRGSSTDHLNFKANGTLKGHLIVCPLSPALLLAGHPPLPT